MFALFVFFSFMLASWGAFWTGVVFIAWFIFGIFVGSFTKDYGVKYEKESE